MKWNLKKSLILVLRLPPFEFWPKEPLIGQEILVQIEFLSIKNLWFQPSLNQLSWPIKPQNLEFSYTTKLYPSKLALLLESSQSNIWVESYTQNTKAVGWNSDRNCTFLLDSFLQLESNLIGLNFNFIMAIVKISY